MVATSQELLFSCVGSIFFFATIFQISSNVLKVVTKSNQGFVLDEKQVPKLITQGPSYICSFLHCLINGSSGIVLLMGMWEASDEVKLFFPPTPVEFEESIKGVEISNTIFVGYLLFDLYHVLSQYPKLGGMDTVIHHLVFLTCSIINGYWGILPFSFSWLIVGEISTVFLNIRWGLIKTGRGDTQIFQVIQYLFALTFFVTRVVIYFAGVMELAGQKTILIAIVDKGRVPASFMATSLLFIAAGCILNLLWFQKITVMAFSKKKSIKKQR
jgi:hypothetical protein